MNPQVPPSPGIAAGNTAPATTPFWYQLPVALLATVVCCPAGIILLWQSRRRPAALVASAILLLGLAGLGAIGLAVRSRIAATHDAPPVDEEPVRRRKPAPRSTEPSPQEALAAAQEAEKALKVQKHAADLKSYQAKTPADRAGAIRKVCVPGNCDRRLMWIVVEAAATDAERKQLTAMADAALKADDRAAEVQDQVKGQNDRKRFAESLDQQLLNRGLNPEAVTATGPANKTLRIRAFFCSRQFAHDFDAGPPRAAGFTRMECSNGLNTVTMDF